MLTFNSGRLKRLQAAKKLRDKRRKDDALTVKNMANVRVRQRAQVHIQGMTTKIANEDVSTVYSSLRFMN